MTRTNKQAWRSYLEQYLFLIWDGLGFFGYDNHKLNRLKGIKPKWYDKFLNPYWIFFNVTFIGIISVVLVQEYSNLGTVKSQQINYQEKKKYELDSSTSLRITGIFGTNSYTVIPRINE